MGLPRNALFVLLHPLSGLLLPLKEELAAWSLQSVHHYRPMISDCELLTVISNYSHNFVTVSGNYFNCACTYRICFNYLFS